MTKLKDISMKYLFENKRVLFIPIFSTRSYETGIYDLSKDGNMARIVSKLKTIDFKFATITIPCNYENLQSSIKSLHKTNIKFLPLDIYGKNAKETRLNGKNTYDTVKSMIRDYDYVVFEQNTFAQYIDEDFDKFIYWCVASVTSKGTPWFVQDYIDIDKEIAKKYITACATYSQIEALNGKSYLEQFYSAKAFDKPIIFFPFRLTDKNYNVNQFIADIQTVSENCKDLDFDVYYTDVNDSKLLDGYNFTKVPSQKEVYLSILKSKPIIPYYDDIEQLIHINICEFDYYNCNVIMKENNCIYNRNFKYSKDTSFAKLIENEIRRWYNERI